MKINKSTGEICSWEWLMEYPNCKDCPRKQECDEFEKTREKLYEIQKHKDNGKWHSIRKQEREPEILDTDGLAKGKYNK